MAITTTCPGCKAIFRLPDELAGKSVRCQKCAILFVVPLSLPGMSMPLPSAVEPAAPTTDVPVESATIEVAPPPSEEALEPIEAALAEPTLSPPPAAVAAPVSPPEEVTPTPIPAPPVRPPSPMWTVAMLGLFLMGMLATGAFAVVWVVAHLEPPSRVMLVPPLKEPIRDAGELRDGRGFGGFKKRGIKNFPREKLTPTALFFDANGQISKQERAEMAPEWVDAGALGNFGPFRVFRVRLELGKTYNFYVSAKDFTPKIRLYDGDFMLKEASGVQKRLFYSFEPAHTGEYLVHISNGDFNVGDFFLGVAQQRQTEPKKVDMKAVAKIDFHEALRVQDPRNLDHPHFGPYHEYAVLLEANIDYKLEIKDADFPPALQITDAVPRVEKFVGDNARSIAHTFRPRETREYRVRVSGHQFGVGVYQFAVTRLAPPAKPPQRILAPLNAAGQFEETRTLTREDPAEPSLAARGPYKEYSVTLAKGQRYRIELTSKKFAPTLLLFDAQGRKLRDWTGPQTASITFTPNLNGVYRIHAAAADAGMQGPYTFKIVQLP